MLHSTGHSSREVTIPCGDAAVSGILTVPGGSAQPAGLVVFAHGSGSGRHSPRNQFVARSLNDRGMATLLMDLLTDNESADRRNVFDIALLGRRVVEVTTGIGLGLEAWGLGMKDCGPDDLEPPASSLAPQVENLPVGLFGASTGAAAALVAAAELGDQIKAVVSRGGRPDLAGESLPYVTAPTLMLVGSLDEPVIELNEQARRPMRCETKLTIVPGATHLFEEPGTLEQVSREAGEWFARHFGTAADRG